MRASLWGYTPPGLLAEFAQRGRLSFQFDCGSFFGEADGATFFGEFSSVWLEDLSTQ